MPTTARWPPPSSERCDSLAGRQSALPRGRRRPVAGRGVARGAPLRARPPRRRAGRRPAGGPRRPAGLAPPRRARGTAANGRRRRPERRRDPRAAARPPRRDVPAADADQALGDLAAATRSSRSSLQPRSSAEGARPLPATSCRSPRPRRAPARAPRRPRRQRRSRWRASSRRSPSRPSTLVEAASVGSSDAGLCRGARRADPRAGRGARCDSPIRCSDRRSSPARRLPRRRSLHARLAEIVPTAEERARHLALATAEPSREIASILEDAARSAHARGRAGGGRRAGGAGAYGSRRRQTSTTPDGVSSSPPTGTTPPATPRARSPCSTRRERQAAPGNERAAVLVQLADVLQAEPARRRRALPRGTLGSRGRRRARGRRSTSASPA